MYREFCYICGSKVALVRENVWHCNTCQQDYYASPKLTVDIALFNDKGEVLLCERAAEPAKGKFDLPGGFVDSDETLEEAIKRELKEELGLSPGDYSNLKYCLSYPNKYPWGKETYDLIAAMFVANLKNSSKIQVADDVASVKFVNPAKLNRSEMSLSRLIDYIKQAKSLLG